MNIKYVLNSKSSKYDSVLNFSPNLIAASSSAMQLCTLNFTITNLPYMNDMWVPGSAKFNKVEKILKLLVRLLPTSLASPTLSRFVLFAHFSHTCHLISSSLLCFMYYQTPTSYMP